MTQYNFNGITKTQGKSLNYFDKFTVTWSSYGGGQTDLKGPDIVIPFAVGGYSLSNETASTIVRVSYNGSADHDELDSAQTTKFVQYNDRVCSLIWLKITSGASATVTIRAWGHR